MFKNYLFSKLLVLLIIFCYTPNVFSQKDLDGFRIVGYYSLDKAMQQDISSFKFKKLTHVNLAFLYPDKEGGFSQDLTKLEPFVKKAHDNGVKILFSIAGNGYHDLIKEDNRTKLIGNLLSVVNENDIDGIDLDLEWGYTLGPLGMQTSLSFPSKDPSYTTPDSNYGPFVAELKKELESQGKLLTAALPSRPAKEVTKEILNKFDFINVMSYDNRDLRRPDRKGNHSSYIDAMDDLDHYRNTLKVSKDKLILGVPFYGRGFGPSLNDPIIGYMNYDDIVETYSGAEWVDHWHLPNGYIMYYNGIPTIKDKTKLAKKEGGGIMIWELSYDGHGQKSLLNAIYEEASR